jgi:maltose O-acetyltransferase
LTGRLRSALERADLVWPLQLTRSDLRQLPRELPVNTLAASPLVPRPLRALLYRLAGLRVRTANVYPGCTIVGRDLVIGRRSMLNRGCFVDASGPVRIGSQVHFGMRVNVVTSTHEHGGHSSRAGRVTAAGVTVEDGCWIGAAATLLPGAHVRSGTIVAAGAVVSGECEPDSIYGGVPARKLRDL